MYCVSMYLCTQIHNTQLVFVYLCTHMQKYIVTCQYHISRTDMSVSHIAASCEAEKYQTPQGSWYSLEIHASSMRR